MTEPIWVSLLTPIAVALTGLCTFFGVMLSLRESRKLQKSEHEKDRELIERKHRQAIEIRKADINVDTMRLGFGLLAELRVIKNNVQQFRDTFDQRLQNIDKELLNPRADDSQFNIDVGWHASAKFFDCNIEKLGMLTPTSAYAIIQAYSLATENPKTMETFPSVARGYIEINQKYSSIVLIRLNQAITFIEKELGLDQEPELPLEPNQPDPSQV